MHLPTHYLGPPHRCEERTESMCEFTLNCLPPLFLLTAVNSAIQSENPAQMGHLPKLPLTWCRQSFNYSDINVED